MRPARQERRRLAAPVGTVRSPGQSPPSAAVGSACVMVQVIARVPQGNARAGNARAGNARAGNARAGETQDALSSQEGAQQFGDALRLFLLHPVPGSFEQMDG